MNLHLTRYQFVTIQIILWLAYFFYFINVFQVVDNRNILLGVALSGVLIRLTVVTFIKQWYQNGRPRLTDWFRLTTFFVVILNFLLSVTDWKEFGSFESYYVADVLIVPTLLVILVGLIGITFGDFIFSIYNRSRVVASKQRVRFYQIKNVYLYSIIALIIAFVQLYWTLNGEIGYGTRQENTTSDISFLFQSVLILANAILAIFAIFIYMYNEKHFLFLLVFRVFTIVQLVSGFLSGMKETLLTPFIIILIPFLLSGRQISRSIIVVASVLVLYIYPLTDNYRTILNNYPNIIRQDAFTLAVARTSNLSIGENTTKGSDRFSERLSLFPYLAYAVETEKIWKEYKGLNRYVYLPVAWVVPRFLLPYKPKSDIGAKLNEIISGNDTSSVTPTTYGWAYYEGGYVFVFLLFIIFGIVLNVFNYGLTERSFLSLILYIEVLVVTLKVESDIYFIISGLLQKVIVCYLFVGIVVKEKP